MRVCIQRGFLEGWRPRTTDTRWQHKSKISEKLGRCGRLNMLPPYLKFGIGIEFSAVQWRLFPLWASVVRAGADCTACFLALTGSVPCAQWFRLLLEDASVGKLHCTISQAGILSSIRKRLWSFKSLNVSGLDRYLTTLNTFCTHMKEAKPKWS